MKAIAFYVYHVCWCMLLFTPLGHVVEYRATSTTSMSDGSGCIWESCDIPHLPTSARAALHGSMLHPPTNEVVVRCCGRPHDRHNWAVDMTKRRLDSNYTYHLCTAKCCINSVFPFGGYKEIEVCTCTNHWICIHARVLLSVHASN